VYPDVLEALEKKLKSKIKKIYEHIIKAKTNTIVELFSSLRVFTPFLLFCNCRLCNLSAFFLSGFYIEEKLKNLLQKKTIKLLELAEEERRLQRSIKEEQILKQVQDRF